MEYIGRMPSGKGQVVRVGSGFASKTSWPTLSDFVPDMNLPIGEPLADHDPMFLFEVPFNKSFGTLTGPDVVNQILWKHPWITPAVMYNTRDSGLGSRNVDYFVNQITQEIIPYMVNKMASIGRTDYQYAIRNFTWGYPPTYVPSGDYSNYNGSSDGYNTFLYWNRPEERPTQLNGYNFGMWSKNGIANNASWDDEFYSKLKVALDNIGFKYPYMCYFDNEIGIDLYAGSSVYPISGGLSSFPCSSQYGVNDIGYMGCCLRDPRSSNSDFLIDGQRTFEEYWNQSVHRDGGGWPCLDFQTDGYNRTPKAFEGYWRSWNLFRKAQDYCLWKGGCEPALTHFPDMVFANALALSAPPYLSQSKFGTQHSTLRAMNGYSAISSPVLTNLMAAPGFYNFAGDDYTLYPHENLSHDYNTVVSSFDPRITTFKNFMTYDFVNYYPSNFTNYNWFRLQHMRRGMHNGVRAGGKYMPLCPWLSAWWSRDGASTTSTVGSTYNKNNQMCMQFKKIWVETIKYAISIGVRKFGVWEDPFDSNATSFWNDVLTEVKDWYDNTFTNQISIYQ